MPVVSELVISEKRVTRSTCDKSHAGFPYSYIFSMFSNQFLSRTWDATLDLFMDWHSKTGPTKRFVLNELGRRVCPTEAKEHQFPTVSDSEQEAESVMPSRTFAF